MKTRKFNWMAGMLVAALMACIAQAESLTLAPNTSHTINITEGVKKIIVGNPAIANASVDGTGRQVVIIASGVGTTELRVQRIEGPDYVAQISVVQDIKPIASQISQLLEDVEGLDIQVVGNKIIFKGDIILKRHWDLKEQVKSAFSGMILDLTRISDNVNKILAEKITSEIGLPTIKVKVSEGRTFLEGYVYDESDIERATRIAEAYSVKVIPLIKVQDVMIETDVYFLQVNSSDAESFGNNILKSLSVNAGGNFSGGSGTSPTGSFSISGSVSAKINALVGAGKAKVLAKPHISTKSGEAGEFHNGGEQFVKLVGSESVDLKSIKHGIILTVKPTLRGRDQIMNEITIEVSAPVGESSGGINLEKFSTSSTTLTSMGESVLISGLTQQMEAKFKEKTPILGSIPIIKELFSERTTKGEEKELILLLTPRPVFKKMNTDPSFSEGQKHLIP